MKYLNRILNSGLILLTVISLTKSEKSIDSLSIYPIESETRQTLSLDGIWLFRITNYSLQDNLYGFHHEWYNKSLDIIDNNYIRMPIPSSFNDITENRDIRDFVGWSWYNRQFFLPPNFKSSDLDILIRFGSINYEAIVWINGHHLINHTGGHLPFQTIIDEKYLNLNQVNRISIACNNQLSSNTVPQGSYKIDYDTRFDPKRKLIEPRFEFDFFHYAGIQRSILLYLIPKNRIIDVSLITDFDATKELAIIYFNISINNQNEFTLKLEIFDAHRELIGYSIFHENMNGHYSGNLTISPFQLWWPYTMHANPGYLYTLKICLFNHKQLDSLLDCYYQKFGIRTIRIENDRFLVNNEQFYFRGFGKHEEYDIRGRALDPVMILKDFNLIKWTGANSFRTSHYPYSEQVMDEADAQGIAVIEECPAVSLRSFNDVLLKQHAQTIKEMIERDKNRPSVFMWSIANEASSNKKESQSYFKQITALPKYFDPQKRPVTAAINQNPNEDYLSPMIDVIMINRYYGWYRNTGFPQIIREYLYKAIAEFHDKFKKPIMISEYGADAINGMTMEPSLVFTEDYHSELLIETHSAFDQLRHSHRFFIGEHIWNFADFMTEQSLTRVVGNKKGIFTRQRQPKPSARIIRCRYWQLVNQTGQYFDAKQAQGFSYCPKVIFF